MVGGQGSDSVLLQEQKVWMYRFCSWPGHYALTKIVIHLILQFVNKRVTYTCMVGTSWIGHFRTVNVEDASRWIK